MRELYLFKLGLTIKVDEIDYQYVLSLNLHTGGPLSYNKYIRSCINGKHYGLHQLIALRMGLSLENDIDHKDRDIYNICRSNLREATRSQNRINSKTQHNNTSGHKNISWYRRYNKWVVRIASRGKRIHIGYYKDFEAAKEAYKLAAIKYHGEFARYD